MNLGKTEPNLGHLTALVPISPAPTRSSPSPNESPAPTIDLPLASICESRRAKKNHFSHSSTTLPHCSPLVLNTAARSQTPTTHTTSLAPLLRHPLLKLLRLLPFVDPLFASTSFFSTAASLLVVIQPTLTAHHDHNLLVGHNTHRRLFFDCSLAPQTRSLAL
jgi:hypothetical protein